MSYRVFFSFSKGLAKPILVPKGTLAALQEHVARVEKALGLKVEKYRDNPAHWRDTTPTTDISDEDFCKLVEEHNRWVRWVYNWFGEWSEATRKKQAPKDGWGRWERRFGPDLHLYFTGCNIKSDPPDTLTPADAQTFWHGLQELEVPVERWSRDYYVSRMQHLYEVMRGNESEGVTFNAKKSLTPRQAAAVVCLFSSYIDSHDMRLDVPNGYDHLASSYDGGYDWCSTCGPVHPDDSRQSNCRRKGCDLRSERGELSWVLKDKAAGAYLGMAPGSWPTKLNKKVRHFTSRCEAEERAKKYTKRALVVVPVGKRDR